jgi:hypothetical protein
MKVALLALGAGICFAQSIIQIQNGPSTGGPFAANAGTGQPFSGKIVTGRPFTAEAVVETDQTLADGSHVTGRQSLTAARDSQGRTYREEIPGTPASGSSAPKAVYISDPVAKVNYFLGSDHVAHKTPMLSLAAQAGAATVSTDGASARLSLQRFATGYGGGKGPVQIGAQSAQPAQQLAPGAIDTKQLGSQVITGFTADGTRTTLAIPAGQVGNQNPLVIVSERWYSQDLEAIVLAKHSDPRVGASSYQLISVQQIEPSATLFQIPSGYTIEEDGQ